MTRLSVSAGASAVMNIDLNDYCQFCGAIIPVTKMINIRKYCSRKCCEADEYRLRKEAILEARADRVCEWCREPIPADIHGLVRYCSEVCAHRMEHARRRERRRLNPRHPPRPCVWCGCSIPKPKSVQQKYCGPVCSKQSKRAARKRAREQ